ncbi:hypothetical protein H4Q26_010210, partial [Puccinia striiformis f. sp. tritici PST-130]
DYKVRYGSLFISMPGAYAVVPSLAAWATSNSAPYRRKASTIAITAISGGFGGLLCVWVFVIASKPRYYLPTGLSIAFGVALIICCILNTIWLKRAQEIKSRRRNQILNKFSIQSPGADSSVDEMVENERALLSAQAWDHLGDQHPDFKYTF